jgi:hypothetical protein
MLSFLIFVAVWVIGAVGCHIHRKQYFKRNPHMWNRRHEGLVAFSDTQYWWIMTLWPLSITAAVIFLIGIGVLAVLEKIIEWWESRHERQ